MSSRHPQRVPLRQFEHIRDVCDELQDGDDSLSRVCNRTAARRGISSSTIQSACTSQINLKSEEFLSLARDRHKVGLHLLSFYRIRPNVLSAIREMFDVYDLPPIIATGSMEPRNDEQRACLFYIPKVTAAIRDGCEFSEACGRVAQQVNVNQGSVRDQCTRQIDLKSEAFMRLARDGDQLIDYLAHQLGLPRPQIAALFEKST